MITMSTLSMIDHHNTEGKIIDFVVKRTSDPTKLLPELYLNGQPAGVTDVLVLLCEIVNDLATAQPNPQRKEQ
jgi:hypothetical protein